MKQRWRELNKALAAGVHGGEGGAKQMPLSAVVGLFVPYTAVEVSVCVAVHVAALLFSEGGGGGGVARWGAEGGAVPLFRRSFHEVCCFQQIRSMRGSFRFFFPPFCLKSCKSRCSFCKGLNRPNNCCCFDVL